MPFRPVTRIAAFAIAASAASLPHAAFARSTPRPVATASATFAPQDEMPVGNLTAPPGWRVPAKTLPGLLPGGEYLAPKQIDGFTPNLNVTETETSIEPQIVQSRHDLVKLRWQILDDRKFPCATGYRAQLLGYAHAYRGWRLEGDALLVGLEGGLRTLVVTYTRPYKSPPDPAAMRALERFCGMPA